jgi:hypothetical protein
VTAIHDSAARAALWQAWRQHGGGTWRPARLNPHAEQYRRAVGLGWLWEPQDGYFAITQAGIEALDGYMPRQSERIDTPAGEAAP